MAQQAFGQIFFSYSRKDNQIVDQLVGDLEARGFYVWIDREKLLAGESWAQSILEAIQNCQVFVIVLSPDSIQSENVNRELALAEQYRKYILPIIVRGVEIPDSLAYRLAGLQTLDFSTGEYGENFETLIRILSSFGLDKTKDSNAEFLRPAERVIEEVQADPSAVNDRPTGPDQLEITKYTRAFAQIVHNPDTSTPLTIGLYAAWGMGKSFLMAKIEEELGRRIKDQQLNHGQKSFFQRVKLSLARLKPVRDEAQRVQFQNRLLTRKQEIQEINTGLTPGLHRWQKALIRLHQNFTRQPGKEMNFLFLTFNAWVYSGSDHLWASLITHLYGSVEKFLGWRAWYFRLG